MLKKINKFIADAGIWIFIVTALYKFTFWIINMVNGFQTSGAAGCAQLFGGLFQMCVDLIMLAVLLEVSRKIAEKYTPAELAPSGYGQYNNGYGAPMNGYNQMPPMGQPQPPMGQPAPQQVQPASNGVWFCNGCGTQNNGDTAFCSKCGKPRS